jgi:hypothetical protein
MPKLIDLVGRKFHRLSVIAHLSGRKVASTWLCICDCGNEIEATGNNLKSGNTNSCGCWKRDQIRSAQKTHGMTSSAEYHSWSGMNARCYNTKNPKYPNYGERGIRVCERWRAGDGAKSGFECFFEDVGPRPSTRHSIDRINVDGDYDPSNVRWATTVQQNNNRRHHRMVRYKGEAMSISQAAKLAGMSIPGALAINRYDKGWSVEDAVSIPVDPAISAARLASIRAKGS